MVMNVLKGQQVGLSWPINIYTASYSLLRSSNVSSFTTPSKIPTHSLDFPPP